MFFSQNWYAFAGLSSSFQLVLAKDIQIRAGNVTDRFAVSSEFPLFWLSIRTIATFGCGTTVADVCHYGTMNSKGDLEMSGSTATLTYVAGNYSGNFNAAVSNLTLQPTTIGR